MIILSGAGTVEAGSITDPSDLDDIWEWWEPGRETFADNDPIGTLTGQFAPGSGHNWTGSGGTRPIYKDAIVNGHGVARFDGIDDEMQSVDPTALTAIHFFAVLRIVDETPVASKSANWSLGLIGNAYPKPDAPTLIRDGTFRNAVQEFSKLGVDLTQWRVVEVISTATEWTFKLDGTELATSGGAFAHQSAGFIRLGRTDPFNAAFLDGDLAGMYICSAKLTTARTAMINYLNNRFGLSAT